MNGFLGGIRVLVVDDQTEDRELLVLTHRALGATAQGVDSVVAALRELSQGDYQVLVSDLRMAPLDGFDLIARVRKGEGGFRAIPAIAVTRYGGAECSRALAAGYHSCLSKPLNPETLVETILRLTKRTRARSQSSGGSSAI